MNALIILHQNCIFYFEQPLTVYVGVLVCVCGGRDYIPDVLRNRENFD